jgi:hypothetical protein
MIGGIMTKEERRKEAETLVAKYPNEIKRLLDSQFTIKNVSDTWNSWVVRDMKNDITVADGFCTFSDALFWLTDEMGVI